MGDENNPYKIEVNAGLIHRARLAGASGISFEGARDLYKVAGYNRHVTTEDFFDAYNRGGLAARIIDAFPDATWRRNPNLTGSEQFVKEWATLERKHKLVAALHRLDRLASIGHYGVLVLGLDGGEPMQEPTRRTNYNLLYVQPHSEKTAQITAWEDDPSSPRFGMPKRYRVEIGTNWTGAGASRKTMIVHWSRVVHIAERPMEDKSIGTPRLERIWNYFHDLNKLVGGGAEIFWQNAAMIMAFIADKDANWQPGESDEMKDQIEEMQNGLRRFLRLRGVDPKQLGGNSSASTDVAPLLEKVIELIAGAVGIPKRILMGSERGELSSSQDENNWAGRIEERREQFAAPEVIEPLIRRLESLGVIQRGGFAEVEWEEEDTLGEQARADIALKKAQALQAYFNTPGADMVVTPEEFRKWLGEEGAPDLLGEDSLDETDDEVGDQFRGRGNVPNA